MARKQAGKHSRSKSNAVGSSSALNNSPPASGSPTPTPNAPPPSSTNAASPSSSTNNGPTLALPNTTSRPASTPASPGGIPLIYRLLLLLYPIMQMLLSAEAPLRPFSSWRHPTTGELISAREELIEPRILVVTPHVRDLGFFMPTVGILTGTEERKGRCWVGVLGLSSGRRGSGRGEGERGGGEEEWKDGLETFASGLDLGLLDIPELQDTPESQWDPNVVADMVLPYVLKYNIDTILTFDEGGITGNPHHTAVSQGVTALVRSQKLKDALSPTLSSSTSSAATSSTDKPSLKDRLWGGGGKSKDEKEKSTDNESEKDLKEEDKEKEGERQKEKLLIHPRAYLLRTPTSPLLNPGLGPLSSIAQHFVLVYRAFGRGSRNSTSTSTSSSSVQPISETGKESGEAGKEKAASTPTPIPTTATTFISNIWIYARSWKALLKISEEMYLGNVLGWMVSRSLWVNEWVEVY